MPLRWVVGSVAFVLLHLFWPFWWWRQLWERELPHALQRWAFRRRVTPEERDAFILEERRRSDEVERSNQAVLGQEGR